MVIGRYIHETVDEDKVFTRNKLANMFLKLLA